MKKTMYAGLITGVITAVMIMAATVSVTDVSAGKNEWGDLASDLGQSGKMGKHSSDPDDNPDTDNTPRIGVGNLDLTEPDVAEGDLDDDDGDRAHPSENADVLRGLCEQGGGTENQCP